MKPTEIPSPDVAGNSFELAEHMERLELHLNTQFQAGIVESVKRELNRLDVELWFFEGSDDDDEPKPELDKIEICLASGDFELMRCTLMELINETVERDAAASVEPTDLKRLAAELRRIADQLSPPTSR